MDFKYDFVVSIGPDCQAATQSKKFFHRAQCVTTPMSYQITPISAIAAYFQQNFDGLFKREDLEIGKNGGARNIKYGTVHPYEFPNGEVSYTNARERHDFLCSRLRSVLKSGGSVLFLFGSNVGSESDYVTDIIRASHPDLDFRILSARSPEPNTVWSHRRLPEWEAASAEAKRNWSHSGLAFALKMQSHRLMHHMKTSRF